MIIRTIPSGTHNTILTYKSEEYINFTSFDAGDAFTKAGEIISGTSFVIGEYFTNTVQVTADDTEYITDDLGNVYFKVSSYLTQTTTAPNRA